MRCWVTNIGSLCIRRRSDELGTAQTELQAQSAVCSR